MQMNVNERKRIAHFTGPLLGAMVLGLSLPSAWAGTGPLQAAVQQGSHIFAADTFKGRGRTCQSCHLAGGKTQGEAPNGAKIPSLINAAAIFPRFNPQRKRVVTLEDQIEACIAGGIGGRPLKYGGRKMAALVSYLTSLSHGQPIDMGGKPK